MSPTPMPVPWETRTDSVVWSSADLRNLVAFTRTGIEGWRDGAKVGDHPWERVSDLHVKVPYSSRRTVSALTVLDMLSPRSSEFSAGEVEIAFSARFDVVRWTLVPHETYHWRLQFVLDDLIRVLAPDFSPLGVPGLLDDVVGRVWPQLRPHSRLLLYTDLLGLDRFLGGHGAHDAEVRAIVHQHGSR